MAEYRDPPVVAPRPFGLFSVERPTSKNNGPWLTGAQWTPESCGIVLNYADALCATPTGTDEVQRATITGSPTGGTYTLSFYEHTTAPIAYNANAATIQSALLALPNLDTNDVVVTGTGPYTFTFGGRYADEDVPTLGATASFTGGTAPAIAITTITPGVRTAKVSTAPLAPVSSNPFSMYVLRECRTVGDYDGAKNAAQRMLTLNEEAGVEREVWARLVAAATDVTPATAPSPEIGLAMLEEAIGDNYAGRPIVHASLNLASYLGTKGAHSRHGTHLETEIGSMFVSGRGYTRTGPGGVPAAGNEWLIASGGMFIDQGVAAVRGPFLVQSPLDNTQVVLAERTYAVGFDCTPVAIRVAFPPA